MADPPLPAAINGACAPPLGSIAESASAEANGDQLSGLTDANDGEVGQTLRAANGEHNNGVPALKLSASEWSEDEEALHVGHVGLLAGSWPQSKRSTQINDYLWRVA